MVPASKADGTGGFHTPAALKTYIGAARQDANGADFADAAAVRRNVRMGETLRGSTALTRTSFAGSDLPGDWVATGWTVSNGLVAPATSGWDQVAKLNQYSNATRRTVRARVTLNDLAAVVAVTTSGQAFLFPTGIAAILDVPAGKLKLCPFEEGVAGVIAVQGDIGFSLTVGRDYLLELTRDWNAITFTLKEVQTGRSASLTSTAAVAGLMWGKPGVAFLSGSGAGNVTIREFTALTNCSERPLAIVLGDSNSEATAITQDRQCWRQLEHWVNRGDILCAARGAETATSVFEHVGADVWRLNPRYLIIALGTNDITLSDQTTWRSKIGLLGAAALLRGIQPVLCTIPPRTGYATEVAAFNADIRGNYFGRMPYIDFAYALSTNNDGVTLNPLFDSGDGLHMNDAGHDAMFAQVLRDAAFWPAAPLADMSAHAALLDGFELSNNASDATNDIDVSAGARLGADRQTLIQNFGVFTKRLDATFAVGTGNGGRDANYAIANATWHAHALGNAFGDTDIMFSRSLTPDLPAPFTTRRYLGSFLRRSGAIEPFKQMGDRFWFKNRLLQGGGGHTDPGSSAVTITLDVPTGLELEAMIEAALGDTTPAAGSAMIITALYETDEAPNASFGAGDLYLAPLGATIPNNARGQRSVITNTSGQIRFRVDGSNSDVTAVFWTRGYKIDRSRIF